MLFKSTVLRLTVALIGVVSAIAVFWVGARFHWDDSTQVVIAVLIALGAVLVEMIISFDELKDGIETIYPALELSLEEQRSINKAIILCNDLKKKNDSPLSRIALAGFDKTLHILNQAISEGDFIYNDIFEANMITLSMLKPGQTFKGVSALIKPMYWKTGKAMIEYRKINYGQARNGVRIERIFILNDDHDLDIMKEIMVDQAQNGISVYHVFKKNLADLKIYPDFSVVEDLNFGLVVHREEMLERVTATKNTETVAELSAQFDELKKRAEAFGLQ